MKKLLLTAAMLGCMILSGFAQQDVMVSQYMFNGLFLNPAYAGTHPYFSSTLLYRTQWVGFKDAPRTNMLAVDGPLANDKMGVGLMIMNDKIGVTNQTDYYANYAYKIKAGQGKLSFGLKAGLSSYKAKLTQLTYWDQGDEVFNNDINRKLIPKFGFGMYYYTQRLYAGISIPTLLAYDKNYDFSLDVEKSSYLKRHYYLNGGYVFDIGDDFKFKPSFLLKYLPNAPVQADMNVSLMYKDVIWLGASFRTGDAIIALLEYQVNKRFRVGYSYDCTLSGIRRYSNGSHEIMLGFDFGKQEEKNTHTARFF